MENKENAFLNQQLNAIAKQEGFTMYTIDTSPESFQKFGFTTLIRRFVITGTKNDTSDATLNVICKTYPKNPIGIEIFNVRNVFEREVYIYNEVLPAFLAFQQEKGISKRDGFFQCPRVYLAINDPVSNNYYIILEDLADRGYKMNLSSTGMDIEHFKLTIDGLAKLHAVSYAFRDQKPDALEEIKRNTHDQFVVHQGKANASGGGFKQTLSEALKELEKIVPANAPIVQRIKILIDNLMPLLLECVAVESSEPFGVLNHGDLHSKNIMFQYNGRPQSVTFIDWQLSRFGSPALDLSLLLFTLTTKEFRQQHYAELIEYYYEILAKTIERLGSKVDQLITIEEIRNQLRKFGKFGFTVSVGFTMWGSTDLEIFEQMFDEILNMMASGKQFDCNLSAEQQKLVTDAVTDAFNEGFF